MNTPLIPNNPPLYNNGQTIVFNYFSVEDTNGNPAEFIIWEEKIYERLSWNSNLMEVTYKPKVGQNNLDTKEHLQYNSYIRFGEKSASIYILSCGDS